MKRFAVMACVVVFAALACTPNCRQCNYRPGQQVIIQYPGGRQAVLMADENGCVEMPPRGADCGEIRGTPLQD